MSITTAEPPTSLAELAQDAEGDYRRLVANLAKNGTIDPSVIQQTLSLAGHDLGTLQRHIDRLKARFKAAAELKRAATFDKQIAAAEATHQQAVDAKAKLEAELLPRLRQAGAAVAGAHEAIKKLLDTKRSLYSQAVQALRETAPNPHDELGALQARREQVANRLKVTQAEISKPQTWREEVETWPKRSQELAQAYGRQIPHPPWHPYAGHITSPRLLSDSEKEQVLAHIKALEKKLPELKKHAASAETELTELDKQLDDLRRRYLDPARGMSWD